MARSRAVRSLAAALGIGALVGLVVAGLGGRIAMRVVALADDREDFGRFTAGGDVVGEVTLVGTLFILVLGVGQGVLVAAVYLGMRRWLPTRPSTLKLAFAAFLLGAGLTRIVNGNEHDFLFVDTAVSLVAFGVVIVLVGLLIPTLVERVAPRRISRSSWGRGAVGAVVIASLVLGVLSVVHAFDVAGNGLA